MATPSLSTAPTQRTRSAYKIIALVGPSAAGKSTLLKEIMKREPAFHRMRSVTTRAPRGKDDELDAQYIYLSPEEFSAWRGNDRFLWTTRIHGNYYGTLRSDIDAACKAPDAPTLIDLEPRCVPLLLEAVGLEAVCLIFVTAPEEELRQRMIKRDPLRDEVYYQERIETCRNWEAEARRTGLYRFVSNADGKLSQAVDALFAIVASRDL